MNHIIEDKVKASILTKGCSFLIKVLTHGQYLHTAAVVAVVVVVEA